MVNFRFGGKLLRPTFDTELAANTWLLQAKDAKDKGLPLPPTQSASGGSVSTLGPFINDVFDGLWGANKGWKKNLSYCDSFTAFWGSNFPLSQITTTEIDRYVSAYKAKGNSDPTLNRRMAVLGKLLKKAYDRDVITKMPKLPRFKEGKGRKRFLSSAEEKALLSALWRLGEEQAYHRCVFMTYTGARDGEVVNLQWSDIEGRRVTLDGKTGHRTITMPTKAYESIKWCEEQGYSKPFPMSYEKFKEAWDKASIAIGKHGGDGWVPYMMRHTCASRLAQRGVDIRRIRDWMGHSDISTTMIYAHLCPDDLDTCAAALDE